MESLGRFPRVLNVLPREKIEGPLRDFLKANPRPHPRPKTRAAGREGVWTFPVGYMKTSLELNLPKSYMLKKAQ